MNAKFYQKGFGLIEVLVSFVIMTAALFSVCTISDDVLQSSARITQQLAVKWQLANQRQKRLIIGS